MSLASCRGNDSILVRRPRRLTRLKHLVAMGYSQMVTGSDYLLSSLRHKNTGWEKAGCGVTAKAEDFFSS